MYSILKIIEINLRALSAFEDWFLVYITAQQAHQNLLEETNAAACKLLQP